MNGHNFFITVSDDDLPYRRLMCEVINQAIDYAHKRRWSNIMVNADRLTGRKWVTQDEQAEAIAYIMSDGFEYDCDMLGLPDEFVYRVRQSVYAQREWQYPLEVRNETIIQTV